MSIPSSRRAVSSTPSAFIRWGIAAPAGLLHSSAIGRRRPLEAQKTLNAEILVIPMIETPEAVENADKIAAIDGIDALLIGTNDLSLEMGIAGQVGHERVQAAYRKVADACLRHKKVLGMGGVYDQELASRYIGMGARMILAGSDHNLLLDAATRRAEFLRGISRLSAAFSARAPENAGASGGRCRSRDRTTPLRGPACIRGT